MTVDFVLVRPARPENVGAAARALKTMGFNRLGLVGSRLHLEPSARWLAHGAGDVLDAAAVYPDLAAALADSDYAVATSARRRGGRGEFQDGADLSGFLSERRAGLRRAALVFGGEESGLSNAELDLCDCVSSIRMAADFPSLNLGQAVMLYAYILSPLAREPATDDPAQLGSDQASWRALRPRIAKLLEHAGVPPGSSLGSRLFERAALLGSDDLRLGHSLTVKILGLLEKQDP